MATIGTGVATLADIAKGLEPDGRQARVIELLSQTNRILDDMNWMEGNLPTGHRVTLRTALPTVSWRLLNQGVAPSKATTGQSDEQCGMLEAFGEVDKDVAELNGNTAAFRLSQARGFIESMNQEMAATTFYGNSGVDPEEFTGLSIRYSSLSGASAQNILDAGGTGSANTSIWLIVWGPETITGIYPKGSLAGLQHQDLGLETVEVTAGVAGNRMLAYRDHFQWKCGLAVMDWRYAVRIANVDIDNLVAESSAADVIKLMSRAIDRIPSMGMGRPSFYVNRTVASMLRIQALNKSASAIAAEAALNQFGQRIDRLKLLDIPVNLCDQLLETEARVT